MRNLSFTILFILLSASWAWSGTYWVDNAGGAANWAACADPDPGGGSRCDYIQMNAGVAAGDTVNIVTGTYTIPNDSFIEPGTTGTSGNVITFQNSGGAVTVVQQLATNGTMEADSNWSNTATAPDSNARDGTTFLYGSYSRKFVTSTADAGIISDNWTSDKNSKLMVFSAWIYSTNASINVLVKNGAGGTAIDSDKAVTANEWSRITGFWNSSIGSSGNISFRAPTGVSGSQTFYVDHVFVLPNVPAFDLDGLDYIKIDGIDVNGAYQHFTLHNGADYNEITNGDYSYSSHSYGYEAAVYISDIGGTVSTHNWIHDNTFTGHGYLSNACNDEGDMIRVGSGIAGQDNSNFNLIENNVISYAAHAPIYFEGGQYNIARNNTIYNDESYFKDAWGDCTNSPSSGYFGNRAITTYGFKRGNEGYYLIEGNRLGYGGTPPDDDGAFGIEQGNVYTISRFNYAYGNGGAGIMSKSTGADYSRYYRNTVYSNGIGDVDIHPDWKHAFVHSCSGSTTPSDVDYRANIMYFNTSTDTISIQGWGGTCDDAGQVTSGDNHTSDPTFTDTDMSDKTSTTLPDLTLQNTSNAIDVGAALTTVAVADTSSGTSLIVTDGLFFFDIGVTTWPAAQNVVGDVILVGGTLATALETQITDVTGDTLTINPAIARSDGDSVWLYKISDGTIVLKGGAPDRGADEYDPVAYNMSPASGDTGTSTTVDPSWSNPTGYTSVDVLFDSGNCPATTTVVNDGDVATYDPGTLAVGTTYAWRVDVNSTLTTYTGTCIEFTTAGGPPAPPSPPTGDTEYDSSGLSDAYDNQGTIID